MKNPTSKTKDALLLFLKSYLALILLAIPGILYFPEIQYKIATYQAKSSLPSLQAAGTAITQYETENGTLPNPDHWFYEAQNYTSGESLCDPNYQKLANNKNSKTPGWGMNQWLNLTLGTSDADPLNFKSETLPKDAILLLPSGRQTVKPLRNGKQTPQALSPDNETPTEHSKRLGGIGPIKGNYGLYLTVGGKILLLTPQEAAKQLKMRPVPDSQKPVPQPKKEINKINTDWETNPNVERHDTHYELKKGSMTTRHIPIKRGRTTIVSIRANSNSQSTFTTQIAFFNNYKYAINTTGTEEQTELTHSYTQNEKLRTRKPIADRPNQTIGFHPNDGYASFETTTKAKSEFEAGTNDFLTLIHPIPAQYAPRSKITQTTNTSIQKHSTIENNVWTEETLEIPPENIPPNTKFLTITVKHQNSENLKLEPIKIRTREKLPQNTTPE